MIYLSFYLISLTSSIVLSMESLNTNNINDVDSSFGTSIIGSPLREDNEREEPTTPRLEDAELLGKNAPNSNGLTPWLKKTKARIPSSNNGDLLDAFDDSPQRSRNVGNSIPENIHKGSGKKIEMINEVGRDDLYLYGGHLQSKMQNESCKW